MSYRPKESGTFIPRAGVRPSLLSLLRFAARQFLASLFDLPPRLTRFEPVMAVAPVSLSLRTPVGGPAENWCGSTADHAPRGLRERFLVTYICTQGSRIRKPSNEP